ncbi:ABC transporter permease [Bacillota bacterium Meth-B3]|nr:ABC transporter permease [Christensenellaceae bacterium]MEA5064580.1 ABC transporter permease [Eubacteriales bacterium]
MKRSIFAAPYATWMALFTIAPLLFVVYFAFTDKAGAATLANIGKFWDPVYLNVLWRSLYLALYCTAICLLVGYPAAYFLASRDFSRHRLLFVLILLPMWMNFLLRTYAMMSLLEDSGIINSLLKRMGLAPVTLIGTEGAVLLGMVYNFVPFMILPIHTALRKMDARVIEAAEDLGANPFDVFRRVVLPLSLPGVVSGITMVFMPAVTTFAISRLLGSGNFWLFGDVIERQFLEANDWNFGSMLSLVMMALILVSTSFLNRVDPQKEGSGAY